MLIEVYVPALPESVADATIAALHKKVGERIKRDENMVDLETDKVVLEVPAPADGVIAEIACALGDVVQAGMILFKINPEAVAVQDAEVSRETSSTTPPTSPSVRRIASAHEVDLKNLEGTGKEGRITTQDMRTFVAEQSNAAPSNASDSAPVIQNQPIATGLRGERRVPMSRLRVKIAERLVQAQHEAAMLTTFNEINLHAVMALRHQYKDLFEKKHGVKLGFMSFFTKAVVESLKRFPAVNASLDGQDIVYHDFYDIGIAVSTERGLVVPVIRDADQQSLADIERHIHHFATRAREGKLTLEEMQGGTFTLTNGGVFGSLLSTPIINPPQVGILGMHKIEDRVVVENGQMVIRPMMYVALSYDHRLIDGRDSVQFLVSVKQLLEDPARLLLNL